MKRRIRSKTALLLLPLLVILHVTLVSAATTQDNYNSLKSQIFSHGKSVSSDVSNSVRWDIKSEYSAGVSENGYNFEASIWYFTASQHFYFWFGEFKGESRYSQGSNLTINSEDLSMNLIVSDTPYTGITNMALKDVEIGKVPFTIEEADGISESVAKKRANADFATAYNYFDSFLKANCNLSMSDLGFGKAEEPEAPKATVSDVSLSRTKYTYNGKTHKPKVVAIDSNSETIPTSSYDVEYPSSCIDPGKYKVTITFKGNYSGTYIKSFSVSKADQKITAEVSAKKYKASVVKNKAQKFSIKAKAKTALKYKSSNTKYVTVTSKGNVTVKKNTPKGTYKVFITASANTYYNKATKTVYIKIQ